MSSLARKRRYRGFSLVEMIATVAILTIVLGVVGQTVFQAQQSYVRTRAAVEAQNNARSALDLTTRLVRQAGNNPRALAAVQPVVVADSDADGQLDRIRIQADWNPPDGDILDSYEDVQFSVNAATAELMIRDGAAGVTTPFVENINQLQILCFDADGLAITTAGAIAAPANIVSADIVLTSNVPGGPPVVFRSSATVRRRE